jgi:uncharacterized protein with von Willebrand factor type A (vWA) domain
MRYLDQSGGNEALQNTLSSQALKSLIDLDIEYVDNYVLSGSQECKDFIKKYEGLDYPEVKNLMYDLFFLFYRFIYTVNPPEAVEDNYRLNLEIIEDLASDHNIRQVRLQTTRDLFMSTKAIVDMLPAIDTMLNDKIKELLEAMDQVEKTKEAYKKEKKSNPASSKLAELLKNYEAAKKQYIENIKKSVNPTKTTSPTRKKLRMVEEELQKLQGLSATYGLGKDDSFQRTSYDQKSKLIHQLTHNQKLRKIQESLGKLKDIVSRLRRDKAKNVRAGYAGITQGSAIHRTTTADLSLLMNPATKLLFTKKFQDQSLKIREYGGKAQKGKGPIVCLIDSSGSMSGDREIYAKAVALALLECARAENRAFIAIHFSSGRNAMGLKVNLFSKKEPYNINNQIDLASYFEGGGTEFEAPLARAMHEIDNEPAFSKADIIMLTDGESGVSRTFLAAFNTWQKRKKVKTIGMLIDMYGGSPTVMQSFCKRVISLDDVLNNKASSAAEDIFKDVLSDEDEDIHTK